MVGKYGDPGQAVDPAVIPKGLHRCCATCRLWAPTSSRRDFGRCRIGYRDQDGKRVPLVTMANDCGSCRDWEGR